ncbi:MAG: cell division protein FtsA [Chloroflexi bacterium]|nr:cell division protein FtsA [Chloroflexota bacterium]
MAKDNTLAAIDLGASKVRVLVGQPKGTGEVEVLGVGKAPCSGMHRGQIKDGQEVARALKQAVEQAQSGAGVPIKEAYVALSGPYVSAVESQGSVTLHPADRTVSRVTIKAAIDQASEAASRGRGEALHVIPLGFSVDGGQAQTRGPLGMSASALEVQTEVVVAEPGPLHEIADLLKKSAVRVRGLVYTPVASGMAVVTQAETERGALVADVGHNATNVALYQQGQLRHTFAVPVGGYHFSNDIAVALGTTFAVADGLKLKHAQVDLSQVSIDEIAQVPSHSLGQMKELKRESLCQLLKDRMQELMSIIAVKARAAGCPTASMGSIVFTGGGSLLPGLEKLGRDLFRGSVRIGRPHGFRYQLGDLRDPGDAAVAGALLWAMKQSSGWDLSLDGYPAEAVKSALKGWVRDILPA